MRFRFGLSLVAMLCGMASCVLAVNAAPVASWRFDKAHQTGTVFKAIVGPDIPMTNPHFVTDAQGESLALNKQSLTIADPHTQAMAILPTQNLTVSMWVALDEPEQYGGLLGAFRDDGNFERGWVLGYAHDKFSFALASEGKKSLTYLNSKTSFEPGRWYHVAATYDGATMSLYVNGALEGQSTAQSGPIIYPDATPFVLGAYRDDNENFPMQGRLREAQISTEVLSAQQIAAQFQAQSTLAQLAPAPLLAAGPVAVPSNKKVIIIGTDGTRPDKMESANIPNLRALMKSGVYSDTAQTRFPTFSGPGWSSMLTGVWGDKHGVSNNAFTGKNFTQYPDFLTRLEKINPKFVTFAAAGWQPLLTTLSGGPLVSDNVDVKFAFNGGGEETDRRITAVACDYLGHEDVDAAFIHFDQVDEAGHAHNPLSPQYKTAIENVDKNIGQILAAIKSRPNYAKEDWLILISTDHGHVDAGGHGGPSAIEKTIFFLANGPDVDPKNLQEPVQIVDIGVTALAHLGVTADPSWNLDGKVQALKTP